MTAPAIAEGQVPPPKKKHAGGRPTKLTDELMARILAELSRGVFFSIACKLAGVSARQGYDWILAGRSARKGSRLHQFSHSCALAIATAEAKLGDVVWDAATKEKSAKIALAMLGRRFPARWSARRHIEGEVKHKHDGQIGHLHGVVLLPIEDLGKDSLPPEQFLGGANLRQAFEASRLPANAGTPAGPVATIEPEDDAEDLPEDSGPVMRTWNPTRKAPKAKGKPGAASARARELLREMGELPEDE